MRVDRCSFPNEGFSGEAWRYADGGDVVPTCRDAVRCHRARRPVGDCAVDRLDHLADILCREGAPFRGLYAVRPTWMSRRLRLHHLSSAHSCPPWMPMPVLSQSSWQD